MSFYTYMSASIQSKEVLSDKTAIFRIMPSFLKTEAKVLNCIPPFKRVKTKENGQERIICRAH